MGKLLYFDPFNGVSGDMILGALVDLGLPLDHLRRELAKLELEHFEIRCNSVERQGLCGTNLQVDVLHGVDRSAHGRRLEEISRIIKTSTLDSEIREKAVAVFRSLGEAEARVHACPLEQVHFHEVGAVDAIVDIVGACIGFQHFHVDRFYTAPLNLGGGTVTFSHGTWPVPAPATAELVKGFPVVLGKTEGELTTPTGAAIVTTLAERSTHFPTFRFSRTGFGAGDREFPGIPNMLRLFLGQPIEADAGPNPTWSPPEGLEEDEAVLLQANIDDMDAQLFGHFLEVALKKGALDVYYIPVHMKKNRPGVLLSLLCRPEDQARMAELVFQETTTLGIRQSSWRRWILNREIKKIETGYGPVRVKIGRFRGRVVNILPEYEDLKSLAEKENLPLKVIRQKVLERIIDLPHG